MSRKDKLMSKLANPASDRNWTLAEVEAVLGFHGFKLDRQRGSHRAYVSPDFEAPVVLAPHGSSIKPVYIRHLRAMLSQS